MARIVTENVVLQISKIVRDDVGDSSTILTDDEREVITAVVDEMDAAMTGAVVELVDADTDVDEARVMGWSVGYDHNHSRDIGYGVPATCDHPGCGKEIDRGLGYVCGGDVYGGEQGCGLFFCGEHLAYYNRGTDDDAEWTRQLCSCCGEETETTFDPTPDVQEWIDWKMTDESWATWRAENPKFVEKHGGERLQVSA